MFVKNAVTYLGLKMDGDLSRVNEAFKNTFFYATWDTENQVAVLEYYPDDDRKALTLETDTIWNVIFNEVRIAATTKRSVFISEWRAGIEKKPDVAQTFRTFVGPSYERVRPLTSNSTASTAAAAAVPKTLFAAVLNAARTIKERNNFAKANNISFAFEKNASKQNLPLYDSNYESNPLITNPAYHASRGSILQLAFLLVTYEENLFKKPDGGTFNCKYPLLVALLLNHTRTY